jgi:hypothetical protein
MAPAVATYAPRDPSGTVLYHVIAEHLETLLASLNDAPNTTGLPASLNFYRSSENELEIQDWLP